MRPIERVTAAGTDLCRMVAADTVVGIETVSAACTGTAPSGSAAYNRAVLGPGPMADR